MADLTLHPDRLLPTDLGVRGIARRLHDAIQNLPIISPHGHTDPAWFAINAPFANATALLLAPDHYLYRMLHSQGIALDELGVSRHGVSPKADPRAAWRLFASHQHLFRGTPSRLWLDHVFADVFEFTVTLDEGTADFYYDRIEELLAAPAYRPRALFERFGIELLATTEGADDPLDHHRAIRESGWAGRVVTAYRPDAVIDADDRRFAPALERLAVLTGEDVWTWGGYLAAHRRRREDFIAAGATSTDHGHPTAATADLNGGAAAALFDRIVRGASGPADHELFRAQMLTEMARMSLDDGMVMQIHPGAMRNHDTHVFAEFGRDKGADIPTATDYVSALKPMLDAIGHEPDLSVILFTLDETAYSRELAPLAGHYPCLKLGPAWWFHDSPDGIRRFRAATTETAGFYNMVGFNDDTRAFLSIPARHDMARRIDCGHLAQLVAEHQLPEEEAHEVAHDLAYRLAKRAYRLDDPRFIRRAPASAVA